MTHGVLNLPRNLLLDWMFGHSLINCHVEHHLFPFLSDNMCLKVPGRYGNQQALAAEDHDETFSPTQLVFSSKTSRFPLNSASFSL